MRWKAGKTVRCVRSCKFFQRKQYCIEYNTTVEQEKVIEGVDSFFERQEKDMTTNDDRIVYLHTFARHVPRTLGQQMLAHLIKQFMYQEGVQPRLSEKVEPDFSCTPSIARFNGALLFVDISGFTILSQRLPVDELRVHINAYFKKILDIIYNHGGDVIKFAGDALFAVWRENAKNQDMAKAVCRAAQCGAEINLVCSNYRIDFNKHDRESSQISSILLNSTLHADSHEYVGNRAAIDNESDHTFLNVHAGLAVGPMAGVDVGALDRWEYLIIGPPLRDVAVAEGEAEKGEMVISPQAHDMLCKGVSYVRKQDCHRSDGPTTPSHDFIGEMPCGCIRTDSGSFKMNLINPSLHTEKNVPIQLEEEKDDADFDFELQATILEDATDAFFFVKTPLMEKYKASKVELLHSPSSTSISPISPRTGKYGDVEDVEGEMVFNYFLHWIEGCMRDDLWRHVHAASRLEYVPMNSNRTGCLSICSQDAQAAVRAARKGSNDSKDSKRLSGGDLRESSFVQRIKTVTGRNSLRERQRVRHERTLQKDSSLAGELRNVIVMFISIKADAGELLFEEHCDRAKTAECALSAFSFLPTTPAERAADLKLLEHYQICIESVITAINGKGGQLRQFIVDDKGTVCIGTFGLRGSVNPDNAAAAIEAAHAVIGNLSEHNIEVGIGITAGQAYCGLVGSLHRHEYAVMGPSTNLSARLMASAKPGHIICDLNIRKGDRLHQYRALKEVKAKGYAKPVPTFRPVFLRGSVSSNDEATQFGLRAPASPDGVRHSSNVTRQHSIDGEPADIKAILSATKVQVVLGREEEQRIIASFLLNPIIEQHLDDKDVNSSTAEQKNSEQTLMDILGKPSIHLRTNLPTRLAMLEGPSGIGKSALLDCFYRTIRDSVKSTTLNAILIRGATSSFNTIDPFKSWKPAIRRVLMQFAYIAKDNGLAEVDESSFETKVSEQKRAISNRLQEGLHHVQTLLTDEEKLLLPLLSSAHVVPGIEPNSVTSALSGAEKISKLAALLFAIIQLLPVVSNKVVFLLFDDAQFLDPSSWKLLQELWVNGRGFVLMLSFSGKVDNHESHPLTMNLSKSADGFGTCDRLCRRELSALDFTAVKMLVDHIFNSEDLLIDDPAMYEKMEQISGGNPLYIYELSKAMIDKYLMTAPPIVVDRGENGDAFPVRRSSVLSRSDFGILLKDFHTARIEEVIFYRFDQLDPQSQMLLKMASVACSSGSRGFSLAVLVAMLASNENNLDSAAAVFMDSEESMQLSPRVVMASGLRKILMKDEFLRLEINSRRNSMSDSHKDQYFIEFETSLQIQTIEHAESSLMYELEQNSYEFKIILERKTIYGLMLEDQRESLHYRVATFIELENAGKESSGSLTSHDLFEEGYHWEKATVWGSAMSCYYRSAMKLDSLGAYQESFQRLTSAYRMLNALRKDAGLIENLDHTTRSYQLQDIISLIKSSMENEAMHSSTAIETTFGLSKEDVFKMFGGDSALLDVGLNVILHLAQSSFTLSDNISITSRLYEDALLMIMLTWSSTTEVTASGKVNNIFGLQERQVVFSAFAGIATMFRTHRLLDDAHQSNEATLYQLIMHLAEASPSYAIHRLQGTCLLHSLHFETLNHNKCNELAKKVKELYNYEEHSAELVKWYGNDRVPFTLAKDVVLMKLRGCVLASNQDITELMDMLPKIRHLHSMGILALPLSSILSALGRLEEAESVFMTYYDTEQSRDSYSFFRDSNPLFVEYFRIKNATANNVPIVLGSLSPLQKRILDKEFLPKQRPLLFDAVSSMAVSVEYLCAVVLEAVASGWLASMPSMNIQSYERTSMREQVLQVLYVAAEYIETAVRTTKDANRLVFSQSIALLSQADVSHSIAQLVEKMELDDQEAERKSNTYHELAQDALAKCAALGDSHQFPLIKLYAGARMEVLGYASDQAKELQHVSLLHIISCYSADDRQEVYQVLSALVPTLEAFQHLFSS